MEGVGTLWLLSMRLCHLVCLGVEVDKMFISGTGRGGAGEGRWGFIMGEGGLYCTGVIVSEPDGVVMDDLGGSRWAWEPRGGQRAVVATRAK